MVQKRHSDNEEQNDLYYKRPRQLELNDQLEQNDQLVSFSESVFPEDASQIPHTLVREGEGGSTKNDIEGNEKLASDDFTEPPIISEKDVITSVPGSTSISSRATSRTIEGGVLWSETPVNVTFLPDYFNSERPIRILAHCKDIYSLLLEHPPRKAVPTGPNYQADVPSWGQQSTKSFSDLLDTSEAVSLSESGLAGGDENEEKLIGTCVIPMPDSEPHAYDSNEVGDGRADCSCQDRVSVRCVRQHIMEGREKLKRILGEDKFVMLGFCEMGEQVTERWTEEEEQLFHKVVFSNPASSGKNFWEILSEVFPMRTKRDIVSYYFNAFMLRRRSWQNRCDPVNIDSDDDEWQVSDEYGDNELGGAERDDSVIESPAYKDDPHCYQSQEGDSHEYDEDVGGDNVDIGRASGRNIIITSETCPEKLLGNSNPTFQLQDKIHRNERGDQEVQDDSCTSSDTGGALEGTRMNSDCSDHYLGSYNGFGTSGSHGYVLEHCDAKVWDAGYMTCSKNEVDFLPTSCMIEEVFGDGSWNCLARDDDKGLS